MKHFDVFNGDADGLCALHQLRLAAPLKSRLITGVKRDIQLLERVSAVEGDSVTVLDISLEVNRGALMRLIEAGVSVKYFDHHFAGEIPVHPCLRAVIDTAPDICTSLLVDRYLQGKYRVWAIVAAFGDNLLQEAMRLSHTLHFTQAKIDALSNLGKNLNYNAYGDSEADLFMSPAALYEILHHYLDPFEFIRVERFLSDLNERRRQDLAMAMEVSPEMESSAGIVYILPDEAWARRVRGEFGNHLAEKYPTIAHAILTSNAKGGFTVSVRAPLICPHERGYSADRLCRLFQSGGGRAGAAGISHLPPDQLTRFMQAFSEMFQPYS